MRMVLPSDNPLRRLPGTEAPEEQSDKAPATQAGDEKGGEEYPRDFRLDVESAEPPKFAEGEVTE